MKKTLQFPSFYKNFKMRNFKISWPLLSSLTRRTFSELRVDKDSLPREDLRLLPESKYGGQCFVTLKCGKESLSEQGERFIKQLTETAKVPILFEHLVNEAENEFLISVIRNRRAIYLEPSTDPAIKASYLNLRNQLDLYATVSKFYSVEGFNCKFPGANIIAIAQNNMGNYSKLEYEPVEGVVETLRVTTEETITKFIRFAFEKARQLCRKKVTLVHKEDERPKYDGLFLEVACEIHKCDYPDLEIENIHINTLALNLVQCPISYDVIVSSEEYGTTITAICAAVCGGIGLYSACEIGDNHCLFVPLQTKLSVTNPLELSPYSIVMCFFDLLEHTGQEECARNLICEMFNTMLRGIKTAEFGGSDKGSFVICTISNNLKCKFA